MKDKVIKNLKNFFKKKYGLFLSFSNKMTRRAILAFCLVKKAGKKSAMKLKNIISKILKLEIKFKIASLSIIFLLLFIGLQHQFYFNEFIKIKSDYRRSTVTPSLVSQATTVERVEDSYAINLTETTGYLEKFDTYAISPTRYIASEFWREITKNEKVEQGKDILPKLSAFRTDILVVDDRFVQFKGAEIKLRKFSKNDKVNAIITCSDNNFDRDNSYCKKWEIADVDFKDKDGYVSFTVNHFSVYAAVYIEVLNVQSNLTKGENWEVLFRTYGQTDLTVEASDETKYNTDLQFVKLYCGEDEVANAFDGDKVFVSDYVCDGEISRLVNKTLTGGRHNLTFVFGDSVAYAQNLACDLADATTCTCNITKTANNLDNDSISDPTGCTGCAGDLCTNIKFWANASTSPTYIFDINMSGTVTFGATSTFFGNLRSTSSEFTILSGANVNADGKGYAGGSAQGGSSGIGPGGGAYASYTGGGGGHGGNGGASSDSATGGITNDPSIIRPLYLGSGGGGDATSTGGYGGGLISILTYGTTTINANLTATGTRGATSTLSSGGCYPTYYPYSSGGGAGGSIMIRAATTTGTATINVNGGQSYTNSTVRGGGGAGGRISIIATSSSGSFTLTAYGGAGYQYGGAGSININTTDTYASSTFNNNNVAGASSNLTATETGTALYINKASFGVMNGTSSMLDVVLGTNAGTTTLNTSSTSPITLNSLTIKSGGGLTHNANTTSQQYALYLITLEDLTIEQGSWINANYLGYTGGAGGVTPSATGSPGYGYTSTSGGRGGSGVPSISNPGGGGGGGHIGSGLQGANNYTTGGGEGGTKYDDPFYPLLLGSGGGGNGANNNNAGASGLRGGGAIHLIANGTTTINGIISADGQANSIGGAGAGGSILIESEKIAGNGTTTAKSSFGGNWQGCGAGGGIALYATSTSNLNLNFNVYSCQEGYFNNFTSDGSALLVKKNFAESDDLYVYAGNPVVATGSDKIFRNVYLSPGANLIVSSQATTTITGTISGSSTASLINYGLLSFPSTEINSMGTLTNNGNVNISDSLSFGNITTFTNNGTTTMSDVTTITGITTFTNNGTTTMSDVTTITGTTTLINNGSMTVAGTHNLTVTGSSTLKLVNISGLVDMVDLNLTVTGATTTFYTTLYTAATLKNIIINSGGKVNHPVGYYLNLNILENLTINTGGTIDVSSLGYAGGYILSSCYPGSGPGGGACYGGGGGGGGGGGACGDGRVNDGAGDLRGAGGVAYGSLLYPVYQGSGGGIGKVYGLAASFSPGSGGGTILLAVQGELMLNGTIEANGQSGSGNSTDFGNNSLWMGGGGGGGSIYIDANIISGTGSISANGGNGGSSTMRGGGGGGGGGGRIAIYATSTSWNVNSATVNYGTGGTALGGNPGINGSYGSYAFIDKNGGTGLDDLHIYRAVNSLVLGDLNYYNVNLYNSSYFYTQSTSTFTIVGSIRGDGTGSSTVNGYANFGTNSSISSSTLTLNGTTTFGTNFTVGGGVGNALVYVNASTTNATNLTIGSGGVFEYQTLSSTSPAYLSELTINSGGILRHKANSSTYSNALYLIISGDATINSGGSINISERGYAGSSAATGSSPTVDGGGGYMTNIGGGGGYGGDGGDGMNGTASPPNGVAYGSSTEPTDLGASGGGGGANGYDGGDGGGAIKLVVGDKITINGSILANGGSGLGSGTTYIPGGGAGGSIWVTANSAVGTGLVLANGGNGWFGNATHWGGGGGGGRIRFDVPYNDFDGLVTTNAGTGYQAGSAGSESGLADKLYRSVGANSANLNTGGATVTIVNNSNTATFSSNLPDNIGVGDILQYPASSPTALAFITSRTSSTTFSVSSWDGNIPTAATAQAVNIYRPFQSLNKWAQQSTSTVNSNISSTLRGLVLPSRDLVASNTDHVVACYNDGTADTSTTTIDGWTTGISNYIKIFTPNKTSQVGITQRHLGKWDTEGYNLQVTMEDGVNGNSAILVSDDYVRIEGLQIKLNISDNNNYSAIYFDGTASTTDFRAAWNIIATNGGGTTGSVAGIKAAIGEGLSRIFSNIIYDISADTNANASGIYAVNDYSYLYNNTIYNVYTGIYGTTTSKVVNNLVRGGTTNYANSGATWGAGSDYNIASDATAPTAGHSIQSTTTKFVDLANRDFHIDPTETITKNAGVTDDFLNYYYYDIDGNTKSYWDIGADELSQAVYRSVGPSNTTALAEGSVSNLMDVDENTAIATFASALPNNVGVGDAIVYKDDTFIVFITARLSATQFTVKNYYGDAPSPKTDDSGWKIYRAFTSLSDANSCTGNPSIPSSLRSFDDCTIITDVITYNQLRYLTLYNDATDTTAVNFTSWITGPQNYITIYTPKLTTEVGVSQRHTGKPGTGYKLAPTSGSALVINADYTKVEGLEIDNSGNSTSGQSGIVIDYDVSKKIEISNNVIHGTTTATSYGIYDTASTTNQYLYNNIIYDATTGIYASNNSNNIYFYNNTLVDDTAGITVGGNGNKNAVNNLAVNAATTFSSGFAVNQNNVSGSDATIFTNSTNNDFHLALSDTTAIDQGTSTPASNATLPLTSDIDSQYRRQWDVGADEASKYFNTYIQQTGGDFSSLGTWESSVRADLSATTTATFSFSILTYAGLLQSGGNVTGETSGATATVAWMSTSSGQVLLKNIYSNFISGEKVYLQGAATNYIYLSDIGNPAIAVAKIDGTWSAADTIANGLTIATGWNTSEYNYVRVYTASLARHAGKWNTAKYILSASANVALHNYENYTEIEGLQIEQTGTNDCIYHQGTTGIKTSKCLIKKTGATGNGLKADSQTNAKIWNNAFYGPDATAGFYLVGTTANTIHLYNNTSYGGTTCYQAGTNYAVVSINNLAQACSAGTNFSGTFSSLSKNNLSSDWTMPGTNSVGTSTVNFYDTANFDLHMRSGSAAKNAGYYLAEDANLAVTDDFEGEARYQYFWDIGADQAPAGAILYRSVGNDSSNLNTGNATMTITPGIETLATFSSALPNNVGVGDVLVYGEPLKIAFISGRASSTVYYIQAWNGYAMSAAISTSTSIYRAHLKLSDWQSRTPNTAISASVSDYISLYGSDIDASSTSLYLPCYASTTPDDTAVTISGWNTSTTSPIRIYTPTQTTEVGASQRHAGVWDDTKYRLVVSNTSIPLTISNSQVRIEGLQIRVNDTANQFRYGVYFYNSATSSSAYLTHSIISNTDTDTANLAAVYINDASAQAYVYNNIAYGFAGTSQYGFRLDAGSAYVYNNTISSSTIGIYQTGGTLDMKNNAIFNNTTDFSTTGGTITASHNASDDTLSAYDSNWVNISPVSIATEAKAWDVAFTDYIGYDFTPKTMFSPLYDTGVTISAVADDIINTHRPTYDAYDIGAYEFKDPRPDYRMKGTIKMQGTIKMK